MKKIKKLAVLLMSVIMVSSCFAGCTDDEYDDYDDEYSEGEMDEEIIEQLNQRTGFIQREVKLVVDNTGKRPMRSAEDIKLIPIRMLDGNPIPEDQYLFRNQLTDHQKKVYDLMRAAAIAGNDRVVMTLPVKYDDMAVAADALFADSGDMVWGGGLSGVATSSANKDIVNYVFLGGYKELNSDRAKTIKEIDDSISNELADMWSMENDIDKVKYAHDYMVKNVSYDYEAPYNQAAYSSLKNKKTVCTGYARGFQYMMQKVGVPCAVVCSDNHAWNVIRLDGKYYEIDVCWDDLDQDSDDPKYIYRYNYFNRTESDISSLDSTGAHKKQSGYDIFDITGTKYSFDNYYGGKSENYGTDFDAYNGKLPAKVDIPAEEKPWWEEGEDGWWRKIDYRLAIGDWEEIQPGVYCYSSSKENDKYKYYYWEKQKEYYMIVDGATDLYQFDTSSRKLIYITNDYKSYVHPSAQTVTEETKPVETTAVTTEETKPVETTVVTTEEIKPVETTVVTTEETKPVETTVVTTEETQPAETTTKEEEYGWWNALDSNWKKSDWSKVDNDIWKIYDSLYATTYYWRESESAYYAVDDVDTSVYFKCPAGSSSWIEFPMNNNSAETTTAATTEDPYDWDDGYDNDSGYSDDGWGYDWGSDDDWLW